MAFGLRLEVAGGDQHTAAGESKRTVAVTRMTVLYESRGFWVISGREM